MLNLKRWNQITAVVTAVLFAFQSSVWAQPIDNIALPSLINQIHIPAHLGSIKNHHIPSAASKAPWTILHLQDAHSHEEGQDHLEALIQHLHETYDINVLFVEGAAKKLDAWDYRVLKDEKLNHQLMKSLVRDGVLGGADLWTSKYPETSMQVFGVENLALYHKNVLDFRSILQEREESEKFLTVLKSNILSAGSRVLNKDLNKFFRERVAFQERPESLEPYLNTLSQYAGEHLQTDLTDAWFQRQWPHLLRYFKIKELEALKDPKGLEKDRKKLKVWLKEKRLDPIWEGKLFDLETDRFDPGTQPRHVIEAFYQEASPLGFSFSDYPDLVRSWGFSILRSEIDAIDLLKEADFLTELVFEKLIQTEEERRLIALYEDFSLLEKLFSLKLTHTEYIALLERKDAFYPETAFKRLPDRHQKGKKKIDFKRLSKIYKKALRFYEGTQRRDEVIFQKMTAIMKTTGQTKALLVTGGFHAPGLQERFQKNNMAYAEVVPRLSKMPDEDTYLEAMVLEGDYSILRSHVKPMFFTAEPPVEIADALTRIVVRNSMEIIRDIRKVTANLLGNPYGIEAQTASPRSEMRARALPEPYRRLQGVQKLEGRRLLASDLDGIIADQTFTQDQEPALVAAINSAAPGTVIALAFDESIPDDTVFDLPKQNITIPPDVVLKAALGNVMVNVPRDVQIIAGPGSQIRGQEGGLTFQGVEPDEALLVIPADSQGVVIDSVTIQTGEVLVQGNQNTLLNLTVENGSVSIRGHDNLFENGYLKKTAGSVLWVRGDRNQVSNTVGYVTEPHIFVRKFPLIVMGEHLGEVVIEEIMIPSAVVNVMEGAVDNVFDHNTFYGHSDSAEFQSTGMLLRESVTVKNTVIANVYEIFRSIPGKELRFVDSVLSTENAFVNGSQSTYENTVLGTAGILFEDPESGNFRPAAGSPLITEQTLIGAVQPVQELARLKAKQLAAQPYNPQPVNPVSTFDFQDGAGEGEGLDFLEALSVITTDTVDTFAGTGTAAIARAGTLVEEIYGGIWYTDANGLLQRYEYYTDLFKYDDPIIRPPITQIPEDAQALVGLNLFSQAPAPEGETPEFLTFGTMFGNGFTRTTSLDTVLGGSLRLLIQAEVPERFPRVTAIYLDKIDFQKIHYYAIAETTELVAVHDVTVRSGIETVMDVTTTVYPREGHTITSELQVGPGISSFYWRGPNDEEPLDEEIFEGRPGNHFAFDSSGWTVTAGTTRHYFPIKDPPGHGEAPRIERFYETTSEIVAASLVHQDHNDDSLYFIQAPAGIENLDYHKRPSFHFTEIIMVRRQMQPNGEVIETRVPVAVENFIFTPFFEFHDNNRFGFFADLSNPIEAGEELVISYRLTTNLDSTAVPPAEPFTQDAVVFASETFAVRQDEVPPDFVLSVDTTAGFGFITEQGYGEFAGAAKIIDIQQDVENRSLHWNWRFSEAFFVNSEMPEAVKVKLETGDKENRVVHFDEIIPVDPEDMSASIFLPSSLPETFTFVMLLEPFIEDGPFVDGNFAIIAENFTTTKADIAAGDVVAISEAEIVAPDDAPDGAVQAAGVGDSLEFTYDGSNIAFAGGFRKYQAGGLETFSNPELVWTWEASGPFQFPLSVDVAIEYGLGKIEKRPLAINQDELAGSFILPADIASPFTLVLSYNPVLFGQLPVSIKMKDLRIVESTPVTPQTGDVTILGLPGVVREDTPDAADLVQVVILGNKPEDGFGFVYGVDPPRHGGDFGGVLVSMDVEGFETFDRPELVWDFIAIGENPLPVSADAIIEYDGKSVTQALTINENNFTGKVPLPDDLTFPFTFVLTYDAFSFNHAPASIGLKQPRVMEGPPVVEPQPGDIIIVESPQEVSSGPGDVVEVILIGNEPGFRYLAGSNFGGLFTKIRIKDLETFNRPALTFTATSLDGIALVRDLEVKFESPGRNVVTNITVDPADPLVKVPIPAGYPSEFTLVLVSLGEAPRSLFAEDIVVVEGDPVDPNLGEIQVVGGVNPVASGEDTVEVIFDARGIGFDRTRATNFGGIWFDVVVDTLDQIPDPALTFTPIRVGAKPIVDRMEVKIEKSGQATQVDVIDVVAGQEYQLDIAPRFGSEFRIVFVGLGSTPQAVILDELRVASAPSAALAADAVFDGLDESEKAQRVLEAHFGEYPEHIIAAAEEAARQIISLEYERPVYDALVGEVAPAPVNRTLNEQALRLEREESVNEMDQVMNYLYQEEILSPDAGGVVVLDAESSLIRDPEAALHAAELSLRRVNEHQKLVIGGDNQAIRDKIFAQDNGIPAADRERLSKWIEFPPGHREFAQLMRETSRAHQGRRGVAAHLTAARVQELEDVLSEMITFVDDESESMQKLSPTEKGETAFMGMQVIYNVLSSAPVTAEALKEDLNRSKLVALIKQQLDEIGIHSVVRADGLSITLSYQAIYTKLQTLKAIAQSA